MPTLSDLLTDHGPTRLDPWEYAGNAALEALGRVQASLIRWDTNETPTPGPYGDRVYGYVKADDATVKVFYQAPQEPGGHTIFLSVPCAADQDCQLGAHELDDLRLALAYQADPTPGIDAFCPIHE